MGRKSKSDSRKRDSKKYLRILPRQRVFLSLYLNPRSADFGNASAAYRRVYQCSRKAAAASASRMLSKTEIRTAISDLVRNDADLDDAISVLVAFARGQAGRDHKRITQLDANGEVASITDIESDPDPATILQSIDIINRLTGAYNYTKEPVDLTKNECDGLRIDNIADIEK